MNIKHTIRYMYPNAPLNSIVVRDLMDGGEPFIVEDEWNVRDEQDNIVPIPIQEELEANWPAAQAYFAKEEIEKQLAETEKDFIQVLEELIDVDFDVTKLQQKSKDKINERKTLRGQLNG